MIAVFGGLGAACVWALTTMCYARASRFLPSASVIALAMVVGLVVTAPAAAASVPDDVDSETLGLLVVAGAANLTGLLLVVTALRAGKVGIVAPIVSTEGAIAAVLAVLAGEQLGAASAAALAAIALGIALAASTAQAAGATLGRSLRAVPALAFLAACCFGVSIYATARASAELPIAWAVAPPRILGVLFIAIPLMLTARLHVTRAALPFVVASGIGEVLGFALFALGSRDSVAIAAVLASQFAAIAAVAAYFLFRERLSRVQLAGVATIVAGVTVLTALQA
jgi:drug/metabolite transporter (DMT)-like permease